MLEMMLSPSKPDVVATANDNKESEHIPYYSQGVIVDGAAVNTKNEEAVFYCHNPPLFVSVT